MKISTVDAFTNKPFYGNPAGVSVLGKPADEQLMQKIASEMNLAETAFLYPIENGYHLRWFTPTVEVNLCGHATLASAHTLWKDGHLAEHQKATFQTRSGVLTAEKRGEWIELDFPAIPTESSEILPEIKAGLETNFLSFVYNSSGYVIAELESEEVVRSLTPNFSELKKFNGVIIATARSSGEFDFVSRVFVPAYGIDEDPVTGAAHCALTPFWSKKLGKSELNAYQASRRGGVLKLRLEGNRVKLIGQAVTVLEGEILI